MAADQVLPYGTVTASTNVCRSHTHNENSEGGWQPNDRHDRMKQHTSRSFQTEAGNVAEFLVSNDMKECRENSDGENHICYIQQRMSCLLQTLFELLNQTSTEITSIIFNLAALPTDLTGCNSRVTGRRWILTICGFTGCKVGEMKGNYYYIHQC